jgi:thioredoxin-dependent peroxiredoxin
MPLQAGDRAPEIRSGAFNLSKLRGKRVVLFFFPKSDTPGCTKEACEFRDASKKFAAKYGFEFPFVADTDHSIAEAYGVWKEKNMYGRKYMGIERTTFLIGVDGKIEKIFPKVKPEGHAAQVLDAMRG